MNTYLLLKTVHVLSAAVLLGTGAGIAYFMLMAHRSRNIEALRVVTQYVIRADWIFTATAVVTQLVSGLWLMHLRGASFTSAWFAITLTLFVAVGACWIPVVLLQFRIARLAHDAGDYDALPVSYHRAVRLWICLGVPAFVMVIALFGLMIFKPGFV